MLSRNSLRAYLVSLGPRMTAIVDEHEGLDGDFIPHSFACDFVRHIASLKTIDSEITCLLVKIVRVFMEEGDLEIRDLLYASMFPGLEEHPHLLSEFAAENKDVFLYYQQWLDF